MVTKLLLFFTSLSQGSLREQEHVPEEMLDWVPDSSSRYQAPGSGDQWTSGCKNQGTRYQDQDQVPGSQKPGEIGLEKRRKS